MERAVEAQLIADVPVGIFLSGGIDSSCVAALAAKSAGTHEGVLDRIRGPDVRREPVRRIVAERLSVEYVSETLHEGNLSTVVDSALDKLDEPLADASLLPTFLLSRLAARHVKVVVGGDGGDELWGGYPTYRAHRLRDGCTPGFLASFETHVLPALIDRASDRRSLPEPGMEAAPLHGTMGRRSRHPAPALDVERRSAGSGARRSRRRTGSCRRP